MPFITLIMRTVSPNLRGELSCWLLEADPGVFVGYLSARVRDKLWEKCCQTAGSTGQVLLVYSSNTAQKFELRQHGSTVKTQLCDMEGVTLLKHPVRDQKRAKAQKRLARIQVIE